MENKRFRCAFGIDSALGIFARAALLTQTWADNFANFPFIKLYSVGILPNLIKKIYYRSLSDLRHRQIVNKGVTLIYIEGNIN